MRGPWCRLQPGYSVRVVRRKVNHRYPCLTSHPGDSAANLFMVGLGHHPNQGMTGASAGPVLPGMTGVLPPSVYRLCHKKSAKSFGNHRLSPRPEGFGLLGLISTAHQR